MSAKETRLPPFRSLLAFRAAASHDRLADAAETLGVTESAVSHQLRQLETLLKTQLFDRTSRRLVLTETGARYLARIDPAIRELEAATEAILPKEGRRVVRLTLPTSMAGTWLLPRLGAFEAANPDLDLQLVPTTRVVDLLRDQIDLSIRYGRGNWQDVEKTFLFDDHATPVAAPGLVPEGTVDIEAVLKANRLIVVRSVPDEWQEWARARGMEPPDLRDALELDVTEQGLQVAEAGHGIAMGRAPYIEERLARGLLVTPFGAAGPSGAAYYLCHPVGYPLSAPARRVRRWLLAEAGIEDGG
ncbi:LysR substrate-binding domain-containing protein [Nisaea acidiphila]|uniref:LysR substrate-binding domain-containing protein n=1 Tax=Nisaea acidiphila TaxID=1862145 RepID=A0A9J7ARQ3_9PROT|nr:LysR substrate-binding domain-containing protein [Nisaea acidiphila]UUX49249.1 LysR substrate-binding domain-containing protein [Nisaea acidiphila]